MKNLYLIKTENDFNQILVFTSKKKAVAWAKKATRWTDEEIEKNIKTTHRTWQGFFNIFPNN